MSLRAVGLLALVFLAACSGKGAPNPAATAATRDAAASPGAPLADASDVTMTLAVELDGPGGKRALHFTGDRNESARVLEDLAPGASLTESVDLASWAVRAMNGDPLEPGTYAVRATWDASRETAAAAFVASAATSLTIPAPHAPSTCRGKRRRFSMLPPYASRRRFTGGALHVALAHGR